MQADFRATATATSWVRSSRCGPAGGNCVELRRDAAGVVVRDSKRGSDTVLVFDRRSWSSFVESFTRS